MCSEHMSRLFTVEEIKEHNGTIIRIQGENGERILKGSRELMCSESKSIINSNFAVYIQIDRDDQFNIRKVYVGKSSDVPNRNNQHNRTDDYDWQELIVMYIAEHDDDIDHFQESEVSYVEAMLIKDLLDNNPALAQNGRRESLHIPTAKASRLYSFVKKVLPILGYRIFEPLPGYEKPVITSVNKINKIDGDEKTDSKLNDIIFTLKRSRGADAKGHFSDEGFVVQKGSKICSSPPPTVDNSIELKLKQLIDDHIIDPTTMEYLENYTHKSASEAATIINRQHINATINWISKEGTLKEVRSRFESKRLRFTRTVYS